MTMRGAAAIVGFAEIPTRRTYQGRTAMGLMAEASRNAMVDAGIPLRHQNLGRNVAMYITGISTTPGGVFSGPMVVSMRPVKREQIARAVQVTSRFPATHGAPIHVGDPTAIGIKDLDRPDFGDRVDVLPDEEPVFWACGVTPQAVALSCKPPLMFTHAPGKMFITDRRDQDYAAL